MKYRQGNALEELGIQRGIVILGNKVRLREKKLTDARQDYKWQKDPELMRLDAAPDLTVSFSFYLLDYTEQLNAPKPNRLPLAVETLDGKHIGNCSCYEMNVKKGEAQLGIMIGERDYWGKGYGADAVITMVNYMFFTAGLDRIYLKTLEWNQRAQRCFKNCGFVPCGRISRNGSDFVIMEVKREWWQNNREPGDIES